MIPLAFTNYDAYAEAVRDVPARYPVDARGLLFTLTQGVELAPHRSRGKFEILFRFYGPLPALFEKSWILPDIEPVD